MKKLNLKQPKYIFPLVILLPIVFLAYEISQFTKGSDDPKKGVVTDNINMSLPDAANEDLERSLAESRKHINSYGYDGGSGYGGGGGYGGRGAGSRNGRNAEMDDYARELEEIQQRSLERQRVLERTFGADEEEKERKAEEERKRLAEERKKNEVKPEVVKKADDASASMFNTINDQQAADAGTRLRFKLLDDVIIKDVRLKKGTYLYGIVTGFGQQRVMASITSILVGDKFIKVSLSVFDNDGMEGFYVPESAFRDMMKDAGAQAMQSNISLDGGYGGGLSGEAVALQALQNMYQSASTAISGNIRKNKARIKYNTIV